MLNTLGREAETVVVEKEQKVCPHKSVKPFRVTSELHGFSYPTGFEPAPMEVESIATSMYASHVGARTAAEEVGLEPTQPRGLDAVAGRCIPILPLLRGDTRRHCIASSMM